VQMTPQYIDIHELHRLNNDEAHQLNNAQKNQCAQNKQSYQADSETVTADAKTCREQELLRNTWTCQHCKRDNNVTAAQAKQGASAAFVNHIMTSDATCFEYTGIPNKRLLNALFEWIEPATRNVKHWQGHNRLTPGRDPRGRKGYKMGAFKCFLVTLVRIRNGFDTRHMAYLFGISTSHVSRIFITWVNLLDQCLKPLIKWPTREVSKANLPESFANFPRTRCVIDCTEFPVEKPFRPLAQKQTFSNYKHTNTTKLLVGIHPCGTIIFL
jgi:hypothetical protein